MERDLSVPHHVKALERFLNISRLLSEVDNVMVDPIPTFKYSWNANEENQTLSDSLLLDRDLKPDEKFIYDTSELTEDNMWLKDVLLSDSSDSSDEEEMSEEEMRRMLKKHKQMKKVREKTRQQSGSFSGYSTSILASENPAFHFDFPSLDYSNKTRREKRPNCRKRPSKESEPLTISDMIDALHSHCDSEEKRATPPQLLIECDGPVVKKPRLHSRSSQQIWRDTVEQVVKRAEERIIRLDQQRIVRTKLCSDIRTRSANILSNLKSKNGTINGETVEIAKDTVSTKGEATDLEEKTIDNTESLIVSKPAVKVEEEQLSKPEPEMKADIENIEEIASSSEKIAKKEDAGEIKLEVFVKSKIEEVLVPVQKADIETKPTAEPVDVKLESETLSEPSVVLKEDEKQPSADQNEPSQSEENPLPIENVSDVGNCSKLDQKEPAESEKSLDNQT